MNETAITVLLVGDNPADFKTIRAALADSKDSTFTIEWVRQFRDGLERVSKKGVGVIVLDLFLPDSQGIETFDRLLLAQPNVPILIVSESDDEDIATLAVHRGAYDYLLRSHIDRLLVAAGYTGT